MGFLPSSGKMSKQLRAVGLLAMFYQKRSLKNDPHPAVIVGRSLEPETELEKSG
jgi:hypothetical protein